MTTILCLLAWSVLTLGAAPATPWLAGLLGQVEVALGLTTVPPLPESSWN